MGEVREGFAHSCLSYMAAKNGGTTSRTFDVQNKK